MRFPASVRVETRRSVRRRSRRLVTTVTVSFHVRLGLRDPQGVLSLSPFDKLRRTLSPVEASTSRTTVSLSNGRAAIVHEP